MQFRFAGPDDLPELTRMNQQLLKEIGHRLGHMTLPQLRRRMEKLVDSGHHGVFFESTKHTIGYALYRFEPEWVHVQQYFIKREYRRTGVGTNAFLWLKAHPWKDQSRIRLNVMVDNKASAAFFESLGFTKAAWVMELAETPT